MYAFYSLPQAKNIENTPLNIFVAFLKSIEYPNSAVLKFMHVTLSNSICTL